jgi:arabinose-5-phosphate isomerase
MTRDAQRIGPDALAVEAAEIMERKRITQILVVENDTVLLGALNTHDLMRARVI